MANVGTGGFALAQAFVRIRPDATGFRLETDAKLKSQLLGLRPQIPVGIKDKDLVARVAEIRKLLNSLVSRTYEARLVARDADAHARLSRISNILVKIDDMVANPEIDAEGLLGLESKLIGVQAQLGRIDKTVAVAHVDVETGDGLGRLALMRVQMRALTDRLYELQLKAPTDKAQKSIAKLMDKMNLLRQTVDDLNASAASRRDPLTGKFESAEQAAARLAPQMARVEKAMHKIGTAADAAVPATDRLRRRFYSLFSGLIYGEVRLFAFGKTALGVIRVWHLVFDIVLEFVAILIPASVAVGAFAIAAAASAQKVYNHFLNLHTVFTATGQALAPMTTRFRDLQQQIQPHVYQVLGDALTVINSKSGAFNKVAMETAHVVDNLAARLALAITQGDGTGRVMSEATEAFRVFSDVVANFGRIIGSVLKALPGFAITLFKVVEALSGAAANLANFLEPVLQIGLYMHGLIVWVGLAVTIITKLGGKLGATAIKFAEWAGKSVLVVNALKLVRREMTLTAAAAGIMEAANPYAWLAGVIVGLTALVVWVSRAKSSTQKWLDTLQEGIRNAPLSEVFTRLGSAQVAVSNRLTVAQDRLTKAYQSGRLSAVAIHTGIRELGGELGNAKRQVGELTEGQKLLNEENRRVTFRVTTLNEKYGAARKSMGLMNAAGITTKQLLDSSAESWLLIQQQVKATVEGYKAMGQTGSVLANDLEVLDRQVDGQRVAMQKLNQAWDQFIQEVTSSQNAFDTFALGMTTLNKNFEKAGGAANTTTHHLGELKVKADITGASIDSLSQSGLALNQAFQEQIANGNSLIDTFRTAGIGGRQFRTGVASIIQPLVKFARGSKSATSELIALAQEAGYKGPISMQALTKWLGKTHNSTKALKEITNQATEQMALLTGAMQNQGKFIQRQLLNDINQAVLAYFGVRDAARQYGNAIAEHGRKSDEARAAQERLVTRIYNAERAMGAGKRQAEKMTAAMLGIPTKRVINIIEHGTGNFTLNGPQGWRRALSHAGQFAGGSFLATQTKHGNLGMLVPGSGSSDTVPAMLTPGEVVVPKGMVEAGAVDHLKGRLPGFQRGGRVGSGGEITQKFGDEATIAFQGNLPVLSGDSAVDFDASVVASFTAAMEQSIAATVIAAANSMGGFRVAEFARKFATGNGHPYVWGGVTPSGWDCSGFVMYVLNRFGYFPPRTAAEQSRWAQKTPDQPGALAWFSGAFGSPNNPGHIGISMGNGMMANANSTPVGTIMSSTAGALGFGIPPGGWGSRLKGGSLGSGTVGELAALWVRAGGPPSIAHLMGAIAMAESGGRAGAHNRSGASGLWQILMPANAGYVHGNVFNPLVNARAAVAIWHAQGLSAWEAYTNGAYRAFMADGGLVQKMDRGGLIPPGTSMVQNNTGAPEAVVPMQRGGRARHHRHHHTLSHDVDRALDIIRHHPFAIDRQNRLTTMLHHVTARLHAERALLHATHGRQRHRLLGRIHHDEHRRRHLHRLLRPVQHEMHIVNVAENHLHRRVAALTRQIRAAHSLHLTGLEHELEGRRSFRRRQIREMHNWEIIPRKRVLERSTRREAHRIIDSVLADMGLPHISYDKGGWLPPGLSLAANRTGRAERVGAGEQKIVLEFRGGSTHYGQFLNSEIQRLVQVKGGGDVQLAFGNNR